MKISSCNLYDPFDNYFNHQLPIALYDIEFKSLYEIACTVRKLLVDTKCRQAICYIDNGRYLLVHENCFQVHYIGYFNV